MNYRKQGLRVFGLSILAVLGLMAFMAGGAQANWLIETAGKELKENASVEVTQVGTGKLIVEKKNIEFQCSTLTSKELKLVASSAKGEGSVEFSGCKAFSPPGSGKESKNCNPINQPIKASGLVLVVLHEGKNYLLFEENGATPFATVKVGELCALVETSNVTGDLTAECGDLEGTPVAWVFLDCSNMAVLHLIRPAPAALFPNKLKFGANEAKLEGEASVILIGALLGKPFGGEI